MLLRTHRRVGFVALCLLWLGFLSACGYHLKGYVSQAEGTVLQVVAIGLSPQVNTPALKADFEQIAQWQHKQIAWQDWPSTTTQRRETIDTLWVNQIRFNQRVLNEHTNQDPKTLELTLNVYTDLLDADKRRPAVQLTELVQLPEGNAGQEQLQQTKAQLRWQWMQQALQNVNTAIPSH